MSGFGPGVMDMAESRRIKKPRRSISVPVVQQNTILWPIVRRLGPEDDWSLTDGDIAQLEQAAGVEFKPEARQAIKLIAAGWVSHDRDLQSPRPKDFRKRLHQMEKLAGAVADLDLDRESATSFDLHLSSWLLNADFQAARDLLRISTLMADQAHQLIKSLQLVQQHLPSDSGGSRPIDDHRFIIYLADQFETSGFQATGYADAYTRYGDSPFRRLVHRLYAMLPIKKRRTQSGVDEAIIWALKERRRRSQKG
jgi:hypothetical protein